MTSERLRALPYASAPRATASATTSTAATTGARRRIGPAPPRPAVAEPGLEAAHALRQRAPDEQVGRLVEAGLALHPDGAVERPERRLGIGLDCAADQVHAVHSLRTGRQPAGR